MKNKFLKTILMFLIIFSTLFSFSVSFAVTKEERDAIRKKLEETNPFELTISEFFLGVGDFVMEYMTFLFNEEVTIQKIIFNKVDSINANFFENNNGISNNKNEAPATKYVRPIVNAWYSFFRRITIIFYMMALIYAGIQILLKGPAGKVKAQELIMKWTMGVAILFFFPYVMKYAFALNESFISIIQRHYDPENKLIGSYVGVVSDLRKSDLEERSPEYITKGSYILSLGSEEATNAYINRLEDYKSRGDAMRIMRALAGITGRMIYVIIWYIMLGQVLVFLFVYYKRYLMIALLIAIFPITMIEYILGSIMTGKQNGLSVWCKEFFINVFTQSIHAVVYGVISGVIMNQLIAAMQDGEYNINWLLIICAINFVFAGEKAFKEIINAMGTESIKTAGEMRDSMKKGAKDLKDKGVAGPKAIMNKFRGKGDK